MLAPCNLCLENETSIQEITGMMARQYAPPEILSLLCRYAERAGGQVAFFLPEGEGWTMAANGSLSTESETALAIFDAAQVSEAVQEADWNASGKQEVRFPGGWARHLHSGAGEVLGMIAGFGDGPPGAGLESIRMEVICGLATLAIEQAHLLGELTFKSEATPPVPDGDWDSEASVREVMQMIAQQSAPAEILAVLCTYLDRLETGRQVAFFLIHNGTWALAANGAMTPQSQAALALVDPGNLSEAIFGSGADSTGQLALEFEGGWARHLFSGTGELLGLMIRLCGAPAQPHGLHTTRIELICRLATLAIEQTNLIEELAFKADHDSLTGLPNRTCYERMLHIALRESGHTKQPVALLYINLDRFRLVNDVTGLATGNRLLEQVGRRLQTSLRQGTTLARMGGDEFAVLVPGIRAAGAAGDAVAARLLHSLSTPFSIDGHEIFMSASIGIGCSTSESNPESLEREAYLALYEAKRAGKARAVHFHPSMATVSPERLEMERRLRRALARAEFLVHYQPQVELATGRVTGAEALLRWRPEGLGLISPAAFIPILEETGLIIDVGRWVLRESCRQGKEWLDRGGPRLRIGVNVSAVQLVDPEFIRHVAEALAETGYPPELLELELTESLFVGEFGAASLILKELEARGIVMALDDFGTGQSSLSYLHRLPFHRLKIDQSFIRGIKDGESCPPIVHNIIQMARGLGMGAIAEGVETAHQAEVLRLQGCEEGQGYYFSRPCPPDQVMEFCGHRRD